MKILKLTVLLLSCLMITVPFYGQKMSKKYKTVKVKMKINAPAERVWQAMVVDYGEIGNFSPYIYSSSYENGSLEGVVGAERKCDFNEKGTRWVHEKIVAIDEENKVMRNRVIDGGKVPLNFDNSQAFYRVKDHGDGTCIAYYEFQFRTKPAFLGGLAKAGFKKQLGGTLVGLKHYVETGEKVTGGNKKYKSIKSQYPEPLVVK